MKHQPVQVTGDVLEKFSELERSMKQPAWLTPVRKAGLARYTELGLPTLHDEDWRFTNVAPIVKLPFRPIIEPAIDGVTAAALKQRRSRNSSGAESSADRQIGDFHLS